MLSEIIDKLLLSSGWELMALLLALAYLVLAAHQRQWCWLAAAISCTIYTIIFWQAKLYMESLLQVFYIVMAGYGWWQWQKAQGQEKASDYNFSLRWHLTQWLWILPLGAIIVFGLHNYTDAEAIWIDTYTTLFSLLATWLITQKAYESWWYWLVIDSFYVYLYWHKGFVATALLFVLYLLLVVYAMYRWRNDQQTVPASELQ